VQNKFNLNAKSERSQCKKIIAAVPSQRGRVSCSNSKNKMQNETFYTEILESLEQCFAIFVVNLCRLDSNFVRFVDARVRRVMIDHALFLPMKKLFCFSPIIMAFACLYGHSTRSFVPSV
jgi:hypothetical protein